MTDQLATNQVSLDDLKRAIACYTAVDGDTWAKEAGGSDYASRRWHALSFAWRAAFEWRDQLDLESEYDEYDQGMKLIQEKLR